MDAAREHLIIDRQMCFLTCNHEQVDLWQGLLVTVVSVADKAILLAIR